MSSSVDAVLVLASCTDTALLCSRRCLDSALRLRSTSMSRSPGVSLVRSYLSLALLPFVRVTGCLVMPIGFVRRRRLVGSVGLARSCASIPRRQTCHSKRRILFGAGFSISSDGHIQGRYEYNKIYKGRLAHAILYPFRVSCLIGREVGCKMSEFISLRGPAIACKTTQIIAGSKTSSSSKEDLSKSPRPRSGSQKVPRLLGNKDF